MKTKTKQLATLVAGGLLLAPAGANAASAEQDARMAQFFEQYVRPVLARECYRCHSEKDDARKGGLTLDTKAGLLKGGDTGPAVVPGNPAKSLLVRAVQYHDPDIQMPPKNKKLKSSDIGALTAWVIRGAYYPEGGAAASVAWTYNDETLGHWSFQQVKKSPVPNVVHKDWVKTPIDSFIAAKLEAKDMEPKEMAGKATLLRRLSFDLTGLPPTPKEVQDFMNDTSDRAYEKVVDRLLASKHFGERWGRHWLDVARYADTKGDANRNQIRVYPYAWAYRDYVIEAFNSDKPYDAFIREQIAADELVKAGKAKQDSLAAMGFLTLGNRFDGQQEEIINDRIDTVTKAFQGLTVSCSRCHDHKFDPIPQTDYYAMRGIFTSSRELEPEYLPLLPKTLDQKSPEYKSFMTEYQKRQDALQKFYDVEVNDWLAKMRQFSPGILGAMAKFPQGRDRGKAYDYIRKYSDARKAGVKKPKRGEFINGREAQDAFNHWSRVVREGNNRRRVGLYSIFRPWHAYNGARRGGGSLLDPAKSVKITRDIVGRKGDFKTVNTRVQRAFRRAVPRSMDDVANIYGALFVEAEEQMEKQAKIRSGTTRLMDKSLEALRGVAYMAGSSLDPKQAAKQKPFDKVRGIVTRGIQGREVSLKSRIAELEMSHPGAPARAMVMTDKPANQIGDSKLFIRGEARNQGAPVPRQFIKIVNNKRVPYPRTDSGRARMAMEISSPQNPLTARVMVNRIWQHMFGEGFVPTPDDLGLQSDAPSHPELIDYLAVDFVEKGWSVKKMIKQIAMSSVYRQSSDGNPRYAQIDPQNRLLWRQNIRRLEFEALRDSILAIGGTLDKTIGGKSFNLTDENSRRRTIYARINRASLPEVLNHFDFANPDMTSGKRYETIVPQQALFMMNSPLVVELAKNLVNRKDFQALDSSEERIKLLYELVYQREADEKDIEMGLIFIGDSPETPTYGGGQQVAAKPANNRGRNNNRNRMRAPLGAWEKYAHALLQTNEASFIN